MKVVNVALSILILLLAIASAVFSFFLFEKRTQLIDGWKKMAITINQSATEMDKGSGTKLGSDLTLETLSHEKYAELDQRLAKLTDQSRKLIRQRDELAETLRRIGTISEMNNVGASDAFKNLTTYSTSKDDVVNGVGALVDRRNKIAQAAVSAAQKLDITINEAKLRTADAGTLDQFARQFTQYAKERQGLENALNDLSRQVGGGSLDFSGNNFDSSLNKVKQALNALKNKLAEADRAIATRDQQIQRQKSELSGKDNQIAGLQKQLDEKNYQLDTLRTALGIPNGEALPMPWKPGSTEVRKRVVGLVADVSDKYGYIAINIGTDSTVPQQLGNKVGQINMELTPGLEMVVSRGDLEVPTSDFITKVKLTKVDKDCSIAEPVGAANGSVKVGDKVWFDIN
jgi:hypothetical protein